MNVLSDWAVDEDFIARTVELAQASEIISLDIFDTALTRITDSPADVFAEVERRLVVLFGKIAKGYAAARERAEANARNLKQLSTGAEDVGLNDIYGAILTELPKFSAWEQALRTELAVEREVLQPVPDILELTRRLTKRGKAFIFVSDMYLPAAFLAEILGDAGYHGWQALYISNEVGVTKASGAIWEVVKSQCTQKILHIGDDEWSDCNNPRNFGITTVSYERARSERRVGGALNPSILPFSYFQRRLTLESRSSRTPISDSDQWRNMGKCLGGIIVGSFIDWLQRRATLHKIDRLYFCARDGWLIKAAWDAAGLGAQTGIESRYLAISRRPLNLACGYIESTSRRLSPSLLSFLSSSDGWTTMEIALQRIGLSDDPDILRDVITCFGSVDVRLNGANIVASFEQLLQRHAGLIYRNLADEHDRLMRYLKQEGVMSRGNLAIVDMGWHGTMQRSLRTLTEEGHQAVSLVGFYYGLWPSAWGNRYAAGLLEAAFASDFSTMEKQAEIHGAVEILEELHSAPHGTVVSYQQRQERWEPVCAENPLEMDQYRAITQHFQEGVLHTITGLFKNNRVGSLGINDLCKDVAIAALGAVILSPIPSEIHLLSQIRHSANFDHSIFDPIICPVMPADPSQAQEQFWRTGWRTGTLGKWLQTANGEQREFIRQLASQHLSHLNERTLKQFL